MPMPLVILNYTYHGEVLVITVVKPNGGVIEKINGFYIIRSSDVQLNQFYVVPIDYHGDNDFSELPKDSSFNSMHIAMGYMLETGDDYYIPASFQASSELEVRYNQSKGLFIKMQKEVNETIIASAKKWFFKQK